MAAMKGKKGSGQHRVRSKAQQAYIFGVLAKKDPTAKTWGRRWAHAAGENGGRTPTSRAAYKALPKRKGVRKHA